MKQYGFFSREVDFKEVESNNYRLNTSFIDHLKEEFVSDSVITKYAVNVSTSDILKILYSHKGSGIGCFMENKGDTFGRGMLLDTEYTGGWQPSFG